MNAPALATRFGRGFRSVGGYGSYAQPLTDDEIRAAAPSVFAENKHGSRSDRYTYIPTIDLLVGLRKEGFEPFYAALFGNAVLGLGFIVLFRHRASLGGTSILALYMQEHHGIRAGKVQLAIDCSVLLAALWVVPLERVAYSVLAAVVMGVFLWISHRPGRYAGG